MTTITLFHYAAGILLSWTAGSIFLTVRICRAIFPPKKS